jgi:hypothetical protein
MPWKFKRSHNGFERVYYTVNRRLYCLQLVQSSPLAFVAYACSRDGEPDYELPDLPALADIQMPPGDEQIDDDLRAFYGVASPV